MSTTHTPGPWVVVHDATRYTIRTRFVEDYYANTKSVSDLPQGLIGFVPRTAPNDARELADARLFAAAPTMYARIVSLATDGDIEAIAIMEAVNGHT